MLLEGRPCVVGPESTLATIAAGAGRRARYSRRRNRKSIHTADDRGRRGEDDQLMVIDLIYVASRVNAALATVALVGMLFATGGWQAALAALALFAGIGFVLGDIALLTLREGASRRRA
jgi:hypothetical protein